MHDEGTRPACFLEVRPIPEHCWPAMVVRDYEDPATLVTVHPSSTREEVSLWAPLHLSVVEMNVYRYAYRQPLVGRPLDLWWMQHECFPVVVPDLIRLCLREEDVVSRSQDVRMEAVITRMASRQARQGRRDSA